MTHDWHYADAQGRQQGPVALDELQRVVDLGQLGSNGLVWRDGWSNWRPLGEVASEIGVRLPAAPPPLPPRTAAGSGRRPVVIAEKDSTARIVLIVVLGVVGVMFLGIILAIAIPAYHDYTIRAKIGQALGQTLILREQVRTIYSDQQRCPFNGEDGIGDKRSFANDVIEQIIVGTLEGDDSACAIEITFTGKLGVRIDDTPRLLMHLGEDMSWQYESTIPSRYLPAAIRNQIND